MDGRTAEASDLAHDPPEEELAALKTRTVGHFQPPTKLFLWVTFGTHPSTSLSNEAYKVQKAVWVSSLVERQSSPESCPGVSAPVHVPFVKRSSLGDEV